MKLFKKHDPTLIFSAYREGNTDFENVHNHAQVANALLEYGVPFKTVQGRYKGRLEQAFVVGDDNYPLVHSIALAYQQAVVLYLDEYRKAYLVDLITNEQQELGQWQATGTPKDDEDYTFDPLTKTHYVVR